MGPNSGLEKRTRESGKSRALGHLTLENGLVGAAWSRRGAATLLFGVANRCAGCGSQWREDYTPSSAAATGGGNGALLRRDGGTLLR